MLDTAAVALLMATSMTTAPTLFFFHIRSAKNIALTVVAAFRPSEVQNAEVVRHGGRYVP